MNNENNSSSIRITEINNAPESEKQTIDNNRLFQQLIAATMNATDNSVADNIGEEIKNTRQQSSTELDKLPFPSLLKKERKKGVMITSPLPGIIRNSDPINFKTLSKSRDENIRKQAMSVVLIFLDEYNEKLNKLLPDIKKYIYFFYPNELPHHRGMKHIGILLQKYGIYLEREWIDLAEKMLDYYDNHETEGITMKYVFEISNVLLSKNMMNELFTYPYGFTKDQINRFNEKKYDTAIPSHVYITNEHNTPSTITRDDMEILSSQSISSPDSISSGSNGGGGKVVENNINNYPEKVSNKRQDISPPDEILQEKKQRESQDTFYTADDMSILDEGSDTFYRARELKHQEKIKELNDLKERKKRVISSKETDELNNKITKLENEIRLLEQSLHSPSSEPSPPSWMVQPGVEYNAENHDQLFEIKKGIEELRHLLANERDEDKRQLYYAQIESLEEDRSEILNNYVNSQKTKSGGKKTKKLRNTKKKRRNKRKKSRKNKK